MGWTVNPLRFHSSSIKLRNWQARVCWVESLQKNRICMLFQILVYRQWQMNWFINMFRILFSAHHRCWHLCHVTFCMNLHCIKSKLWKELLVYYVIFNFVCMQLHEMEISIWKLTFWLWIVKYHHFFCLLKFPFLKLVIKNKKWL